MRIVKGAYLADGVIVTGDVVLGAGVNLWYGTIVRGDLARVTLGDTVNIQDGCILHTDVDAPLEIDSGVVAGHAVVLHGSKVGADTLLGIGCRLHCRVVYEGHAQVIATALERTVGPCLLDEDLPHGVGGNRREVGAILPGGVGLAQQADVGLVHQRRGLQREIRALAPYVPRGQTTQFLVDLRPERIERILAALANRVGRVGHRSDSIQT